MPAQLLPDKHLRRSGGDYAQQYLELLPTGQAWPREPGSILVNACFGLNNYWGFVDGRAGDLLEVESDPRLTTELLPDWERAWGLPDPCYPDTTTLDERRKMLILQMTLLGEQSRDFFIRMAAWIGHQITITERSPFMVGVSRSLFPPLALSLVLALIVFNTISTFAGR